MNRSKLVLTDSGGLQEEAPSIGKPVLLMREPQRDPKQLILVMLYWLEQIKN